MIFLKLSIALLCGSIAVQDFRERAVLWILFPLTAALLATLYLKSTFLQDFLWNIFTNLILVSFMILILYIYTHFIRGKAFLNHSIGLGDVLFFYAFALGFPTFTFVTLFVCSLLFSLFFFSLARKRLTNKTIPLAGLMGLFLTGLMLTSLIPGLPSLYTL
ncbi:general secretion pathway protein [Poritiphilus flavus]|uniref:General secretion pathway protein n=1 Tax=Poritiphilus flavus TaxID=2697053 RepID=A0A6L9ECX1_9FLAO|nr:general secretion pathway protein [Poritiphilus flavus]NAS12388.1 general secretion pathway protein [Poritiphilus flavus]